MSELCNFDQCGVPETDEARKLLCAKVAELICRAGGAGVFEATPCSMQALEIIASSNSGKAADMRQQLGIVGFASYE